MRVALAVSAFLLLAGTSSAWATVPGRNGQLAFSAIGATVELETHNGVAKLIYRASVCFLPFAVQQVLVRRFLHASVRHRPRRADAAPGAYLSVAHS